MEAFKETAGKYLSGGQSQAPVADEPETVQGPNPAGANVPAVHADKAQEGHASSGGMSAYVDKAKSAARDYLNKHPVKEGEPQTGFAGYLDQAKLKAKEYLDKDTQGATQGAGAAPAGGLGFHSIVEKLLGMFKKQEGRDLEPNKEDDYHKLSALAKQYLHMDISAETLKTHVSSFLGKFHGSATAPAAPATTATPAAQI